jgi:type I restriction enzyme, S subunit
VSDLNDLPEGWIETSVGQLTKPSNEKVDPTSLEKESNYIGLEHIKSNAGSILGYGISSEVRSSKSVFKKGDLLYGKLRPYLNKVYLAEIDGICSTDIMVFPKSETILNQYAKYRFLSDDFVRYANANSTGVQHPRVKFESLAEFPILLPPLNEQRRIVSTIEQLTDRSHKARAVLEDIPKLIEQFRQSVLAAAFRGDLTADWREKNPNIEPASEFLQRIGIEPQSPLDFLEIHSLPQKWKWASVGSISKISGGLTKNSKREEFPLEYPYLRVANVYANKLDLQEIKTIRINQQELARVLLEKGDILVVEGNGSIDQVGRVAMWDGSISPCLHQNHLIKIRFNLPEMAEFALLWLLSEQGRRYIMSVASSSSGLHTLSLSKVSALPIPVAPENEQKEIVKRITALFDALTVIENRFTSSEEELNQLDRSILAKAFRGELVPQDPNDEPAAVLLERIRAEREQTSTPKQRGKTTRKNSNKQLSIDLE